MARRKSLNMTQEELASKAGISRGQIANLETDRSDLPMSTFVRISHALDCSPKELFP